VLSTEPKSAPRNTDNLAVSKVESDFCFSVLERVIDEIQGETPIEKVVADWDTPSVSEPFRNIARILCAEAARRQKDIRLMRSLIDQCTNPMYVHLFTQWESDRKPAPSSTAPAVTV